MRLAHFTSDDGPTRVGVVSPDGEFLCDLRLSAQRREPQAPALPGNIEGLLADGHWDRVARLAGQLASDWPDWSVPIESVRLRAPLTAPPKIIGVGMNYADHAEEAGVSLPPEPVFFAKFASSIVGPGAPVVLPAVSDEIDWEAELAVVIGKRGRHVPPADAVAHVAGYTVANDVSARDWQLRKPLRQWLLGKTFDSFLPLGPYLVSADEIPDPYQCRVTCILNDTVVQDAPAAMHFRIPELIAYVSQVVTLEPGDIILTGSPAGVGAFRTPPVFLQPGDTLTTGIAGVGVLSNPVVKEEAMS